MPFEIFPIPSKKQITCEMTKNYARGALVRYVYDKEEIMSGQRTLLQMCQILCLQLMF